MTLTEFAISGIMEISFGFVASIFLHIIFSMISFGGETISFSMGLTMASSYDPVSGAQKPIVAQLISLTAIVLALSLDFHHLIFMLVGDSLNSVPLGGFIFKPNIAEYLTKSMANLFIIGFTMAFPILAVILLTDIIFGMIMKTHPQFNLLAIGFPVKISIAFVVIVIALPAIMTHFKRELEAAFEAMRLIFF